ncbi:MAG: tetratricopeptide repeat protein [Planctomycetota bacterium]|nr:MAG: tetratricopeptide repeat protein [Planctomycetota bacterium]
MLPRFLASVRSRRRWALLLVVGVAAALAGRFFWAEFQLRAARRALERRAYPEAQAHLQRYLQVWPRSATAHLLGARCSRGAGNFDEAFSLLSDCRQLHADREALILEEYLLDAQRGTLGPVEEEALRHRLERGGPETPDILEAMALGCLYTNRLGEAMACVERWLAYAPGDSQALYLRGLAREGMGAVHEAGEDYRQAVRRDPEHVPARKRRAEYLIYTGAYPEAAALFQQLLEREPQDVNLVLGLARCRRAQGKTAEAERLLDQLLGHGSAPAAVLVERSCLARETGDFGAAEKWYRQALAQDPSDYDACYGLGQCLRALGRPKEAQDFEAQAAHIDRDLKRLRQLHEQMARNPDNVELPYEAGMICLRNGQKNEARRWFRNVLQGNPYHEGARKGLEQSVQ